MSKNKEAVPSFPEIDFVSSLPLEESVRLMGALASTTTKVVLTQTGPDHWLFEVVDSPAARRGRGGVQGKMRRWEGTYTRIECRSYVNRPTENRNYCLRSLALAFLMGLPVSLAPVVLVFALFSVAGLHYAWLVIFPALVIGLVWMSLRAWNNPGDVSIKYGWSVLQVLINAFKAAGDVSMDGANLNPDNDPGVDAVLELLETERAEQRRSS